MLTPVSASIEFRKRMSMLPSLTTITSVSNLNRVSGDPSDDPAGAKTLINRRRVSKSSDCMCSSNPARLTLATYPSRIVRVVSSMFPIAASIPPLLQLA